ncbi:NBR1-Ig-like domain-containing protein [Actinomadura gamaensis]|uniref:NBR1-Ig-like domain-containing protein n=1 Tax=Actinomadura gamaensis TaxID=1763541 RepID=A0ABV9TXG8_9ACTN
MRARAEAIEHFAAVLRELRNSVGNPSFREMSGRSKAISHATLHEATKGNRLPSWPTTVEFVKACGADPEAFRERWEKANLVVRSVSTGGHPIVTASAETPTDASSAEILPSGQTTGEILATNGALGARLPEDAHSVDAPTGDVLLAVPEAERRKRFRLSRPVAATVAAAVVTGGVVVGVVFLNDGSSEPAGHNLNPSGATSEAGTSGSSCPVHAPQPSPSAPAHEGDASIFVKDVTLPDCTHVAPGKKVTKTWRIKNIGKVPWTGYSLARLDLPQRPDQCRTATHVPIEDTPPGASVDISTDIVTPSKPGLCYVRFKMLDATGTVAFPGKRPVNFQIIVDEP